MQVTTCKHEGHEYFLNKLYSDTKKRIDNKYRQRIKWLTKEAATARIEAEQEAEKQSWVEIDEMQAECMEFGRLKPFGTKDILRVL